MSTMLSTQNCSARVITHSNSNLKGGCRPDGCSCISSLPVSPSSFHHLDTHNEKLEGETENEDKY